MVMSNEEKATLDEIGIALEQCQRYFLFRDRMNAAIHLQPARLSPITEGVNEALGKVYVLMGIPKEDQDLDVTKGEIVPDPHFPQMDKEL